MKPLDFTRFPRDNKKWLYRDITEKIIGAAIEVHRILGDGFLEYVYQESLCYELRLRKILFEVQKELDIWYKDLIIPKKYTSDLIVEDCVIVEIKATDGLTNNNEAQLLNYLKATKKRVGLLLNFGTENLEIKRRILCPEGIPLGKICLSPCINFSLGGVLVVWLIKIIVYENE